MNIQSKQKSNVQQQTKHQENKLINIEANAKLINSLIEKQQETTMQSQEKLQLADNYPNILNSKDIEIFNNIANKLTSNTPLTSTQKKKRILSKNASCENIKSLIDNKYKEMEIYNKINNFSLKYSNGQPQNLTLNTSPLTQRSFAKNKSKNNSVNKSDSKNTTPNKKQNLQ